MKNEEQRGRIEGRGGKKREIEQKNSLVTPHDVVNDCLGKVVVVTFDVLSFYR